MEKIALIIGYVVIALGTIAAIMFMLGIFCDYSWRKLKDAMAWRELQEALEIAGKRRREKEKK